LRSFTSFRKTGRGKAGVFWHKLKFGEVHPNLAFRHEGTCVKKTRILPVFQAKNCLSSKSEFFWQQRLFVFLAKRALSLELWMRVCFFKESMSSLRSVFFPLCQDKLTRPPWLMSGTKLIKKATFCFSKDTSFGKQAPLCEKYLRDGRKKKDFIFSFLLSSHTS